MATLPKNSIAIIVCSVSGWNKYILKLLLQKSYNGIKIRVEATKKRVWNFYYVVYDLNILSNVFLIFICSV